MRLSSARSRAAALITFATLSLAGSMPAGTARADGDGTWSSLDSTAASPGNRLAGAAVYDLLRQRFVGFGGTIGLPVDTWTLDLSGDPAWTPVQTDSTSPPGSYGMTTIYDPVRDRMIIFGGSTSENYYGV